MKLTPSNQLRSCQSPSFASGKYGTTGGSFQDESLSTANFKAKRKIQIELKKKLKAVRFFAQMWLPSFAAYLALVRSLGINQFQSGSVEINDIFLVDGVFDRGERRERKDNILEKS